MMNIQWKNHYFESIDPKEARRILDEELYGLEPVSYTHLDVYKRQQQLGPGRTKEKIEEAGE